MDLLRAVIDQRGLICIGAVALSMTDRGSAAGKLTDPFGLFSLSLPTEEEEEEELSNFFSFLLLLSCDTSVKSEFFPGNR